MGEEVAASEREEAAAEPVAEPAGAEKQVGEPEAEMEPVVVEPEVEAQEAPVAEEESPKAEPERGEDSSDKAPAETAVLGEESSSSSGPG